MDTPAASLTVAGQPARSTAPSDRQLRRGGALFGFNQVLGLGLGFLGSMFLVRIATPGEVASYLLLLQAIMAVGILLQLGLGPAALRFAPMSRGEGGVTATALLRRRLFGLQVAIWAVVVPPFALAWPWIARRLDAPELASASLFVVGAAVLASFGHLVHHYLRAFRMYSVVATLSHPVPRGLILGGYLALWALGVRDVPWEFLISIFVLSQLVTALGFALALKATSTGEASEARTASSPPDIGVILGATTALGLRSAALVVLLSSDLWILSWARSHEEVAIYGVAARVLQVISAIPAMANFIVPQEFSMLYADGRKEEMERLARTASTSVAMLSFLALLSMLALGRPLIHFAFGDTYLPSWSILMILAVGSFWDTACGSAGYALQMSGHHNRLLGLSAAAAAFNIAISALLAPVLGGHGVALGTAISLIALNMSMVWSARKLVGVRTFVYLEPARWRQVFRMLIGKSGEER
ncbi:MAG TPA: polysaccharide biosynthesis C-terminal domain-containing protein [Thermoanaerobaculia bacterium]|nr:polysaccharide biosynthesis C-terminal domain-containing protein [Thermoanaerobaculia bacterium]